MEEALKNLSADNPSVKAGRTIFLKQVKEPEAVKRMLQPASSNKKLGSGGGTITKGKWKGMPMYQLTLEERKTCPRTCQQWTVCYGNNMPFANRIDHESSDFYDRLSEEITSLSAKHRGGFVVRLHVLGDFFSVKYVNFWVSRLKKHSNLRLFGYTHNLKKSPIGNAITRLNAAGAWIRWSDAGNVAMAANVNGDGITCPEQTGKTASCTTCGLCWSTPKPINFLVH